MTNLVHVVCHHCDAANRLPAGRLQDHPRCGKCKQALFEARPVELSADKFDRFLERNDLPVLIDFWAPWCGPCHQMAPAFEQAAVRLEPYIRLIKLNVDDAPAIAQRFNVRSVPTLCMVREGKELARRSGASDVNGIVQWAASQHAGA